MKLLKATFLYGTHRHDMIYMPTNKNDEDPMKNEGAGVVTLNSYILDVQGELTLKLVVRRK